MMYMVLAVILTLIISCILFFLSYFISKKKMVDLEKSSPFECGFNLMDYPRNPFSARFFLISIVFLIFDVELIMLMPFMLGMFLCNSVMWMILIIVFIYILMWGLVHEMFLGSLDW